MKKLYLLRSDKGEPLANFGERYLAQAAAAEQCGAVLLPQDKVNAGEQERVAARDAHLACGFLNQVDKDKYKKTLDYLADECLAGRDIYPKTVGEAVDFPSKRSKDFGSKMDRQLQFAQAHESDEDSVGSRSRRPPFCFNCGRDGYTVNDCPHCNKNLDQRITRKEAKKWLDKQRGKKSGGAFSRD